MKQNEILNKLGYTRHIEKDWGQHGAIRYELITENNFKQEVIFYIGTKGIRITNVDLEEFETESVSIDGDLLSAINNELEEMANTKMGDKL
jgi:hypothetical protein